MRWGQANAFYQKLIERLNWIENRKTTLEGIDAGCVIIGQNWNGEEVLETQKKVYEFYGFNVPEEISFNWQFTDDSNDESQESYKEAPAAFGKEFEISITRLKESLSNRFKGIKRLFEF